MNNGKRIVFCSLLLLTILLAASLVIAQPKLLTAIWYSIGGGGGTSDGDRISLEGSIGYWGTGPSVGGVYSARADFLGPRDGTGGDPPPQGVRIYLPSITR